MVKLKYDVSGTDPGAAADFVQAKPGVYTATIKEINPGFSKGDDGKPDRSRPRLEVIFSDLKPIADPDDETKYAQIWRYLSYSDNAEIYMAQFLEAIGVAGTSKKSRKGTWDPEEYVGTEVKIRVGPDKDQGGEYRAKVAGVFPLDDEEEGEEEYDEDEGEEGTEDEAEDGDEDEEEEDYSELTLKELREAVVDRELKTKAQAAKIKKKTTLIDLLEEDDGDEDEDGDEDSEEEEGDEDEDTDEEDGDEDEDEDEDDVPPYEEWETEELKEEAENRDLSSKGSKKAIIARLEKYDEEEGDDDDDDVAPFDE